MSKDLLLYNAHLAFPAGAGYDAVLISNGTIKQFGNSKDLLDLWFHDTESLDLAGQTVLPGFCDFHLHLQYFADRLDAVDCDTASLADCLDKVKQRAELEPEGNWIIGYGWDQNNWQPAAYGTAAQLDAISRIHPILLHAKSLHAAWANSLALKLAGIDASRADPEKGVILRDQQGEPTGILLEYAVPLVEQAIPRPSAEQIARKILQAQNHLHRLGFTAVHNFDRFEAAQALLTLVEQDQLRLRVRQNLPAEGIEEVLSGAWRSKLNRPPFLTPGWLKLFADGALGPQSAAMLEPYEGSTESGMLLLSAHQLAEVGRRAASDSWPLAIHAIGDRAVKEVLNGIVLLRRYEEENQLPRLPHRIEHIQLIQTEDFRLMKELDVIASVQPVHATSDMFTADHHWGKRCRFAYAYQSMIGAGLKIRFGSDAPVESPNPFEGIFAATTRQRLDGSPSAEGWYPEQRVSLPEAIQAFSTPLSSDLRPEEKDLLRIGSPADLIVLEVDPYHLQAWEISELKPSLTMVAGEIVYAA